jgi:hypothetical protein
LPITSSLIVSTLSCKAEITQLGMLHCCYFYKHCWLIEPSETQQLQLLVRADANHQQPDRVHLVLQAKSTQLNMSLKSGAAGQANVPIMDAALASGTPERCSFATAATHHPALSATPAIALVLQLILRNSSTTILA